MINHLENILKLIHFGDRVLDVGGGLAPFSRADAVVDIEPSALLSQVAIIKRRILRRH